MSEQEQEKPDPRATGRDAVRAAEVMEDMRAKSAPYAKGEFNSADMYHIKKEGDNYVIVNTRTNSKTPHKDPSHKAVIRAFREDPDYGEPLCLTTDYEGAE